MKRSKTVELGKLGRAEAIGAIFVISLYVCTMLAAHRTDSQLFMTQLFFFSLITFSLVVLILAFDRLSLHCARVSKYVIAGCVVSSVAMFALVNFIISQPAILQVAALSSITPTAGLVLYQVAFVGVGEGLIHYVLIRLGHVATKNWGAAILIGSSILGAMHFFTVGYVPLTLVFLGLMFVIIAGLSMTPALLGGKIRFSLIISAVVHMIYNVCIILMQEAEQAAELVTELAMAVV